MNVHAAQLSFQSSTFTLKETFKVAHLHKSNRFCHAHYRAVCNDPLETRSLIQFLLRTKLPIAAEMNKSLIHFFHGPSKQSRRTPPETGLQEQIKCDRFISARVLTSLIHTPPSHGVYGMSSTNPETGNVYKISPSNEFGLRWQTPTKNHRKAVAEHN